MYISDSGEQIDDGSRINEKSVLGLPKVRGRFGCPNVEEYCSFFAVRSSGSMDEGIFQQYVKNVILPLYPNIGPQVVRDDGGRLLTGPVCINCDTGPGRLQESYANVEWRSKMKYIGLHLGIGCHNVTSVSQVMDDISKCSMVTAANQLKNYSTKRFIIE